MAFYPKSARILMKFVIKWRNWCGGGKIAITLYTRLALKRYASWGRIVTLHIKGDTMVLFLCLYY